MCSSQWTSVRRYGSRTGSVTGTVETGEGGGATFAGAERRCPHATRALIPAEFQSRFPGVHADERVPSVPARHVGPLRGHCQEQLHLVPGFTFR